VAKVAFELASKRRKKVTSVDKATCWRFRSSWRATVTDVAQSYPGVALEHQYVERMAMHIMNSRAATMWCSRRICLGLLSDEQRDHRLLGMLPRRTIGAR